MKAAVIGSIIPWSGPLSDIPDGWIICDGTSPNASDFPLLVQAIGDTYNQGTSNLGGGFPAYTGQFKLPDLLGGRSLMDIEGSYFAPESAGGTGNIIDTDVDARPLIEPFIGENTDNGINTVFNDVTTDVIFTLNDRNDYGGAITGNTIIPGSGEKTVFIGGRKLGHQHIRTHQHPGTYETLAAAESERPGKGVIPYDNITLRLKYATVDFTDGVADDGEDLIQDAVDEIRINLGWYKDDVLLYDNGSLDEVVSAGFSGFGNGSPGRTVGRINSENPPINLSAGNLYDSPLAVWGEWQPLPSTPSTGQPFLTSGDNVPYGLFGQTLSIPDRFRNFYPDQLSAGSYGTFVSNDGSEFLDDTILAHVHDPFQVVYDQNSLKPQPRLNSQLNIPNAVLDNTSNAGALQIDMNTAQPTLTCVYIIRAY